MKYLKVSYTLRGEKSDLMTLYGAMKEIQEHTEYPMHSWGSKLLSRLEITDYTLVNCCWNGLRLDDHCISFTLYARSGPVEEPIELICNKLHLKPVIQG